MIGRDKTNRWNKNVCCYYAVCLNTFEIEYICIQSKDTITNLEILRLAVTWSTVGDTSHYRHEHWTSTTKNDDDDDDDDDDDLNRKTQKKMYFQDYLHKLLLQDNYFKKNKPQNFKWKTMKCIQTKIAIWSKITSNCLAEVCKKLWSQRKEW